MLSGRVAFVTGGGSGIGRATCQVLAREGAQVVIVDLHEDMIRQTLERLPGNSHSYYVLDVTDAEKIQLAVENIIVRYKVPPTIVVNCAGVLKLNPPLEVESTDVDMHYAVNVKGTFNVMQIICKEMIKHNLPGSVINTSSVIVTRNLGAKFCDYAASKAAVLTFTKFASSDLGRYNIRCNAILPGVIMTPMVSNVTEEELHSYYVDSDLRRPGQPEEVAEVIAFLASDKSSYVTGATIHISGGL